MDDARTPRPWFEWIGRGGMVSLGGFLGFVASVGLLWAMPAPRPAAEATPPETVSSASQSPAVEARAGSETASDRTPPTAHDLPGPPAADGKATPLAGSYRASASGLSSGIDSASASICGARTSDGRICQRRVDGGRYCWQHSSGSIPSYTPSYSGGTVHVRGYYRKDGTYVRPYTRRAPRR